MSQPFFTANGGSGVTSNISAAPNKKTAVTPTCPRREGLDYAGKNLRQLLAAETSELVKWVRSSFLKVSNKSASLQNFCDLVVEGSLPKNLTKAHLLKDTTKKLLITFGENIEKGVISTEDTSLAAMVLAGKLRSKPAVSVLLKSVLDRQDREDRGCTQRPNRTLMAEEQLRLEEAGFTLANCTPSERQRVFAMFGATPPCKSLTPLRNPLLPDFWCAASSRDAASYSSKLQTNVERVLPLLGCSDTRDYVVIWDGLSSFMRSIEKRIETHRSPWKPI